MAMLEVARCVRGMVSRLCLAIAFAPVVSWARPPGALGQEPPSSRAADSRYEIYLLTGDQGEAIWERFGHSSILIRDLEAGQEIAWNWGLFESRDVGFVPWFLRGNLQYSMGPMDPGLLLASFVALNRTVYSNRVNLTEEEAAELDRLVRASYLPESRDYTYHPILDNCSTRVREALDRVLGGLLQATFANRMASHSYRWHARRLVQGSIWMDQGLSFLLGLRGDVPRTEWETMFAPMEMMTLLEGFERVTPDGESALLLGPRDTLFLATRPPTPAGPPEASAVWLLLGFTCATGFLVLSHATGRGIRWAKGGLALGVGAWGVFSACFGGILLWAWLTDQEFVQWNMNILYLSPFGAPLAASLALSALPVTWVRERARRFAVRLTTGIAAASVGGALAELLPFANQGNGEVLAVALPINVAVALSLARSYGARDSVVPGCNT